MILSFSFISVYYHFRIGSFHLVVASKYFCFIDKVPFILHRLKLRFTFKINVLSLINKKKNFFKSFTFQMVEHSGIEPLTFTVQTWRSPSWANAPIHNCSFAVSNWIITKHTCKVNNFSSFYDTFFSNILFLDSIFLLLL